MDRQQRKSAIRCKKIFYAFASYVCVSLRSVFDILQDRYAEGRYLPPIDASQDWFLVSGEEEGGYTILEFTRNLTTCDSKDLNIEVMLL